MSYKIQFVDDKTFESLPGRNMETKLGVAYPKYGTAFVRQTGINAVDVFNAAHELEHLKGDDLDEHFDAEHGAYYKDFGNTMKTVSPFLAAIPGVGPIASVAANVGGGMMSQNYQNKKANSAMLDQRRSSVMDGFMTNPGIAGNQGVPNVIQADSNWGGSGSYGDFGMGNDNFSRIRSAFGNYAGR